VTPTDSTMTASAGPWILDRGRAKGEMGYLPGLDGIRALAVIGVLLYHADLTWVSGGYLGVDVFFVLSGFLITTLILEEYDRSGGVRFSQFYLRRARRLFPAVVVLLAVVGVAAALVYRDAAGQVRADSLASLFYVNNWKYVIDQMSYFEFIGRPPMLKHLWSLSVEEQFYFVWPAVAFLLMRRWNRRGVRWVAIALALLSTAWMIRLSVSNAYFDPTNPIDPSRAYFGTDSHAMGLLVGAALATFWRPGRLQAAVPTGARVIVTGTGVAALVAVLGFFLFVGEDTAWMYTRGGFLVLALVVALLIAMATHPASPLGGWLGTQPWRYIGQRSYGLYLWHWPIFMVTRPTLDVPLDGLPLLVLRLGLTFGIAELSYRFVEMPIRRGLIDRWVAAWRSSTGADRQRRTRRGIAAIAGVLASVVFVGAALSSAASATPAVAPDVAQALGIENGGPTEVSLDDPGDGPSPSASATGKQHGSSTPTPSPTSSLAPNQNGQLSGIGDSVMLGARDTLKQVIPGTKVDAAVSRFPGAFIGRLKRYVAGDKLAPVVVLHPGTNGTIPEDMMRQMLDILKDTPRVVVVNDQMPRTWEQPNNKVIAKVVPDYPNAVLADWNKASANHPEYFVSDGIHLTPKGARAYAQLIKKSAGL
jgi:peptidoglycan/LPS O-acetylase OafA/YrhL